MGIAGGYIWGWMWIFASKVRKNRKGCECVDEKARRCVFNLWKTTCILRNGKRNGVFHLS